MYTTSNPQVGTVPWLGQSGNGLQNKERRLNDLETLGSRKRFRNGFTVSAVVLLCRVFCFALF